eukprot:8302043-Prorocentrum_lima.AAC.1
MCEVVIPSVGTNSVDPEEIFDKPGISITYRTWSWSECFGQQCVESLWTSSVANQSRGHLRQRMRMAIPFL